MFATVQKSLELLDSSDRRRYWWLVFFRSTSGLFDVLGILLIGLIAGFLSLSPSKPQSIDLLGITLEGVGKEAILILAGAALLAFLLKAIYAITIIRKTNFYLARVETRLSIKLCNLIFSGGLSSMSSISKSEIIWALGPASSAAYSGLLSSASIFIAEGALLFLILVVFLFVDLYATFFVLLYFAVVVFIVQTLIKRKITQAAVNSYEGNVSSMSTIEDLVTAFRELRVLGRTQIYVDKFANARSKKAIGDASHSLFLGMPRYIIETALMFGVLLFVGFQFVSGNEAEGFVVIGVFLTGGLRIMGSLLPMQNAANNIRAQKEHALLFFNTFQAISSAKANSLIPGEVVSQDKEKPQQGAFSVVLDKVSFTYPGAEKSAISDVSFQIKAGSQVAIIGPSGAGKTTLVDLILGLLEPSMGYVLINNQQPMKIIGQTPGKISYVPQRPGIVAGTIAENVALGLPPELLDEDKVLKCLEDVGLLEFLSQLPDGIYSSVGEQLDSLSGGQIQRIGLARALYTDPSLLILDEATSALDASAEAAITSTLSKLSGNVTLIVIAHRLSTVQHSDNVFVVDEGQIRNSGPFSGLKRQDPMVAEYVRLMTFED